MSPQGPPPSFPPILLTPHSPNLSTPFLSCRFFWDQERIILFISSDRSSCTDDGLLYIRSSTHFFRFGAFMPFYTVTSVTLSRFNSINAIEVKICWLNVECSNVQIFKCSNVQIFQCSNVKCQMSGHSFLSQGRHFHPRHSFDRKPLNIVLLQPLSPLGTLSRYNSIFYIVLVVGQSKYPASHKSIWK